MEKETTEKKVDEPQMTLEDAVEKIKELETAAEKVVEEVKAVEKKEPEVEAVKTEETEVANPTREEMDELKTQVEKLSEQLKKEKSKGVGVVEETPDTNENGYKFTKEGIIYSEDFFGFNKVVN